MEEIEEIKKECHNHNWINMEQEETLRSIFTNKTNEKLWLKNLEVDPGFSEEYVYWLEEIVLNLTKP